ncbi:MAG: hypothetical protein ABL967_10400 [Bryobacteraceae bacterium]
MALNIAALDAELESMKRRAQMIEEIKRLAADPEALALLEKIATTNSASADGALLSPSGQITLLQVKDKNGYAGMSQINAIRQVIRTIGTQFVVGSIGAELRNNGIPDISNIAVGRVLQRLQKNGEIRLVEEGAGNQPNVYEPTESLKAV